MNRLKISRQGILDNFWRIRVDHQDYFIGPAETIIQLQRQRSDLPNSLAWRVQNANPSLNITWARIENNKSTEVIDPSPELIFSPREMQFYFSDYPTSSNLIHQTAIIFPSQLPGIFEIKEHHGIKDGAIAVNNSKNFVGIFLRRDHLLSSFYQPLHPPLPLRMKLSEEYLIFYKLMQNQLNEIQDQLRKLDAEILKIRDIIHADSCGVVLSYEFIQKLIHGKCISLESFINCDK